MDNPNDHDRLERIESVMTLALPRVSAERRMQFQNFAQGYFHHMESEDLAGRAREDLLGALLSCWQWGEQREPGTAKLRILSPTVADQGWASRHSVIEIVNDDMPFLVDTTTMEINRQGLTLHLIVHPVLSVLRDPQGQLLDVLPRHDAAAPGTALRESWMHVEVDRLVDPQQRADLVAGLAKCAG